MSSQAYLLQGPNLPTKLCVVAFDLEHDVLLDIENRFQKSGNLYNSLTPVHKAVVKLADKMHGPTDQAYFPGREQYRLESAGGTNHRATDNEPGRIENREEAVETPRRVFIVTYGTEHGIENWAVVLPDEEGKTAKNLAEALAQMPGKATIECKYVMSGTFLVDQVSRQGFKTYLAPTITVQPA